MTTVLDHEFQSLATEAICHEARMSGVAIQNAASQYERPSAIYRPRLSIDGNQWCALYGDNLQEGVAGFGDSPAAAMQEFDKAWGQTLSVSVNSSDKADDLLRSMGFPDIRGKQ